MRYKITRISAFLILLLGCLAFLAKPSVFAQTPGNEKRRVKDFGSSLNSKKEKNKSEKTAANDGNASEAEEDVIKVETTLVRTEVLVVDKKGKAILGLKPSDFVITEEGVPQEIGTFSLGDNMDVPKSIVLIIDYSGSQMPFIENSVGAAKVLIDKLNPKDRMAIVNDDVELVVDFTNDKQLLKKKLDSLKDKKSRTLSLSRMKLLIGRSLQFSALMATLNEMFDKDDVRPIVIFQSDGDEAFSITKPEENNTESSYTKLKEKLGIYFTVSDLFNRIEKSRATRADFI
ncbi:MAG: VWA domain-containing protein [Acidobacteriota bacterium]|nr:VWA domain-containing protein [Acidobacteriota bacterium]